ncbi:MAG: DUF4328 domain-containing protein [Rhodococcus sp. (in: high G+C Gram-positive bacteria)]
MSAFQVCARCATRWPVGTRPALWCPRCHGVLLSPVSAQAPAQGRRNFKWVARAPRTRTAASTRTVSPGKTPTPKYDEIPRWGLTDRPVGPREERETRLKRWASAAPGLLTLVGALLSLAVVAELVRYSVLLYNRTRLVGQTTVITSDALVFFAEIAAIVIGVAAAVASACWLVRARRAVYERAGSRDPRSARSILLGCLVPVLSLVMPGVYLTEVVNVRGGTDQHRLLVLVRIWWATWIANWLLIVAASLWRLRDSLQAQADGVLLAALVAFVGAALAVATIGVIRGVDGLRWRGTARPAPTRWVVATTRATTPETSGSQESHPTEETHATAEKATAS